MLTSLCGLTVGVLPVLVPLLVLRQTVVRLGAHWLGEVAECLGVVQVQFLKVKHNSIMNNYISVVSAVFFIAILDPRE